MSLRDDLIPDIAAIRAIPADMGVYGTRVYLRTETYTTAIKDGASLSSAGEVEILPSPRVNQVSVERAQFYGGGVQTDSNGVLQSAVYKVGPITPSANGAGYALTDLLPTGTTTSVRKLLRLSGADFQSAGEVCEIVDADATQPFRIMLTVRRAGTVT